jgi:hypothetical protein
MSFDLTDLHTLIVRAHDRHNIPVGKVMRVALQAAADGKFPLHKSDGSPLKLNDKDRDVLRCLAANAEQQTEVRWWTKNPWSASLRAVLVTEPQFWQWLSRDLGAPETAVASTRAAAASSPAMTPDASPPEAGSPPAPTPEGTSPPATTAASFPARIPEAALRPATTPEASLAKEKPSGGAKSQGIAEAIEAIWSGNIPKGLSAKERDNKIMSWCTDKGYSRPSVRSIQRALKTRSPQ